MILESETMPEQPAPAPVRSSDWFNVTLVAVLSFALGFSIRSEYVYRLGVKEGQQDQMKSLIDLVPKMHSLSVPIGTNMLHIKFEPITSGLTPQQSAKLYNAVKELQADAKTNKISEAKESK